MRFSRGLVRQYRHALLGVLLVLACLVPTVGDAMERTLMESPELGVSSPAADDAKIEPGLFRSLRQHGQGDYYLHFAQRADLRPAYGMDWEERGHFVYDVLRRTAEESQQAARAILNAQGVAYESFFAGNVLLVRGGSFAKALTLAQLPEVAAITEPRTFELIEPVPEGNARVSPLSGNLAWGVTDVGADQFWPLFGHGKGITVASIDTGVQWDHPALAGSFKCGDDPTDPACWRDPSNICRGSACDNNGHGTHVTGTMVGADDSALTWRAGVAPGSQWIACKGCEGRDCTDFALLSCADWVLAPDGDPNNRPHVVNNSWGSSGGDDWYQDKVAAWRAAGIFPVFAAGNSGSGCETIDSPGDYQGSFAVAAHDGSRTIASFSSRGPSVYGDDPFTKPNISAPGVAIPSAAPGNGWRNMSGTSMASPHVAGVVALLWSCNPELQGRLDATMRALQDNADPAPDGNCGGPDPGNGNYTYGHGFLNVLAVGERVCDTTIYTVTVLADPDEGGEVSGGRAYLEGDQAEVRASPNENWIFVNWTEDGVDVSPDMVHSFMVKKDRNLTANFTPPAPEAIPTLSDWGMIILTGLLLLAGAGTLRKRSSAVRHGICFQLVS